MGGGGGADGDEGDVGSTDGFFGVGGGAQTARGMRLGAELVDVALYDGGTSGVDQVHLVGAHIASYHFVAHMCEAGGSYAAHITKSEYAYVHVEMQNENGEWSHPVAKTPRLRA